MRAVPLTFELTDPAVGADLIHELNLHEDVTAHLEGAVLTVECLDTSRSQWAVRSTVTLFDPTAREVSP